MGFPVSTRATDFLVTAAVWNADLVGNMNSAIPHLLAYKSADESMTSDTTLQNDDHLFFAMAANELWSVNIGLHVSGGNDSNIKIAFILPSGSMMLEVFHFNTSNAAGSFQWVSSGVSQNLRSNINGSFISIDGTITNAGTAGNFQLQWAQAASVAVALTVKKGSTITGFKLA
jgi:hypothetical protein